MPFWIALTLYRLLLPGLLLVAFPGWILKMLKRGGLHTHLGERASLYTTPIEFEPCAATHIHAVSVGETMLALKLIRQWTQLHPDQRFVLATGTATGHHLATSARIPDLRVTYSPLDLGFMVRRYLRRFQPARIVLIEAEAWPHLLLLCARRSIPVHLINARMSPRSARRYQKFSRSLQPIYQNLTSVAIQEKEDATIWENLGVAPHRIHHTGSLKFDPGSGPHPTRRPAFQTLLDAFGPTRPVILAASTFPGEETLIADAIRTAAPHALPVIVPRHAERRAAVKAELERIGFTVTLRSTSPPQTPPPHACLVIDSTGELRDWTSHADLVIIGKSFLSTGGQNPAEAILAHKPIILGPHMENFQPLVARLIAAHACFPVSEPTQLTHIIHTTLTSQDTTAATLRARDLLTPHEGATLRIITLLTAP